MNYITEHYESESKFLKVKIEPPSRGMVIFRFFFYEEFVLTASI